MKRILIAALLAVCLLFALSSTAFAESNTFNAYLEVTQNEDGSVSVTIPEENEAVLRTEVPTLSIPCTMLDPVVTHNGETVASSVADGMVSFPVAHAGVYTITDSSAGLSAMVKTYSLTLEGQIGLNFRVQIPADLQNRVHAVFVYKDTETSVNLGTPISGTTDEFRFTYRVPAKEIGNPVGLRIETENGQNVPLVNSGGAVYEGNTAQYSVADYCKIDNLGQYDPNGHGAQLEALAAALQNYGAYALSFFGSGDTDPGFASSGEDVSGVSVSGYDIVKNGALEGLSQTSMFLTLESETTINLRFEVADGHSIEEYSFTYGSTALTPEPNNGSYLIRLSNIPAKDLDTPITVTVTSGEETFTVTCCALTYAQLVLNNSTLSQNTALCNTVKAMYLYNQAGNAYFEGE
ncbi:MAG: hypothetical protein IIY43_06040 [Oscillospiraceae bacterium]|nr:hypothetical protein [Lachnospiraceae bacterium]MBQ1362594.1 hypothetical protein [Oscillospiraceae bacterium]